LLVKELVPREFQERFCDGGSQVTKQERAAQRRRGCLRWLLLMALLALGAVFAVAIIGYSVIQHFSKGLPDVGRLKGYEPSQTTRIYASGGELIATLFKENRTYSKIEEIAPAMSDAIVAVEDSRFRQHIGVDFRGVARAMVYDLQHKGAHQGASTITMQLARNLFLTPTRSFERKIREVLLSLEIEKRFTKDEILELYLNQIYYGSGAYGIASAAQLYFDKKPKDLTIAEASLLAGLPQAPSEFSPFVDEQAAKHRQVLVLGRMRDTGAITMEEYRQAIEETRKFDFRKKRDVSYELLKVPYFTTYALRQLAARYSEELLYRGGLTIHTTVDFKLQKKCEQILAEMIAGDGRKLGADTGAIVLIENKTGYIRAMVGGTGWSQETQFNRAWQALRQPGSTFKPVLYAAAVEKGWTPQSTIDDSPLEVKIGPEEIWKPKNSDLAYMGKITLSEALKYSRNVAAVRLGQSVGIPEVIKLAYKMGVTEKLLPHPSLALGSIEVSPLEMATVYTVFPNEGIGVDVIPIKRVVDAREEAVEEHTFANKRDVLGPRTAQALVEMMKGVVDDGTAQNAILKDHDVAGKTGTTDSFRDAWFIGFTADYTAAVWVGRDDNSQMKKSYGGDLPARIWKRVMMAALEGHKPSKFFLKDPSLNHSASASGTPASEEPPRNQLVLTVCKETRLRAQPGCPAIVKVMVESVDEVDWCSRHSAQAPQLTDWEQRGLNPAPGATDSGSQPYEQAGEPDRPTQEFGSSWQGNSVSTSSGSDSQDSYSGSERSRSDVAAPVRGSRESIRSVSPMTGSGRGERRRGSALEEAGEL
jgi:1A family penicillin-binding protein